MATGSTDTYMDGNGAEFNISTFDLLLIELVPLAERMARAYEASLDRPATGSVAAQGTSQARAAGQVVGQSTSMPASSANEPSNTTGAPLVAAVAPTAASSSPTPSPSPLAADGEPATDIYRDSVYVRLERLGFRVGQGLAERFSRDRPRFTDQLDVIKFVCKDLWGIMYKKQIDNLKTNHRGVFVLTDNKFRPFSRMSMASSAEAVARAQTHLFFPCGVVRGVLSSLGIKATVQAETNELPSATFQIKTAQAKT
ncbi:hypothetical protein PV10_05655 [Exophiala mesophila]|uniref:Trafficking protein particle complex subunit 6B n=1 Tax=Exophiala mesophila TaxID=212818 RepID=A0A0D1Z8P6_EXOME|nr:uncharacterized protein PV10_05655 [Exophiala mesophila]KIV91072.1 hypothetical protein PV10_05655 [Exophiala mesophila]